MDNRVGMSIFSEAELEQLSAQVDEQLRLLKRSSGAVTKSSIPEDLEITMAKQMEAIAQATQSPPKTVLQKIYKVLRKDLCEENGELNKLWKSFSLGNKDLLKSLERILLVEFGWSDHKLALVMVAVAVYVLHLGVRTFCEEFGQES
jgi:hypothetical protein